MIMIDSIVHQTKEKYYVFKGELKVLEEGLDYVETFDISFE